MSVAIWIVVLLLNSHSVFVTKPAPTEDSTHKNELHLDDTGEWTQEPKDGLSSLVVSPPVSFALKLLEKA